MYVVKVHAHAAVPTGARAVRSVNQSSPTVGSPGPGPGPCLR